MSSPGTPAPAERPPHLWQAFREALAGHHHDHTSGSLHRSIFALAVPMVLELALESVFAVVDIYFVNKLPEKEIATSAIGLTEAVMSLLFALAFGLSMGTTASVARRVGEKDIAAANRVSFQAVLVGVVVSIPIAVAGLLFAPRILEMMRATPDVVALGSNYTRITIGSNVLIMLLFIVNAAFRGAGDAFLAMRALWLANGINIVLDPCLIHGYGPFPQLGVTGAAVATSIGRGTGVLYCLWSLWRGRGRLCLRDQPLRIDPSVMLRLVRVSLGGIGQMLIATASWMVLMWIVARFGKAAVAGYTVAIRLLMFTILPAWGLSNAAATLTGQNLGAGNPERAERAVWLTGLYNMVFMVLVTAFCVFFGETMLRPFELTPSVEPFARDSLRIIAYGYVFYAWAMVMMQAFNGAGDTMTPTKLNVLCFWMVQIPMAWLLSVQAGLGPPGVFWSVMGAESLLAVVSMVVFRRGYWKTRAV